MEITLIIAIIGPIASFIFSLLAMRQSQKAEDREYGSMKQDLINLNRLIERHDNHLLKLATDIGRIEQQSKINHDRIDILAKKAIE